MIAISIIILMLYNLSVLYYLSTDNLSMLSPKMLIIYCYTVKQLPYLTFP